MTYKSNVRRKSSSRVDDSRGFEIVRHGLIIRNEVSLENVTVWNVQFIRRVSLGEGCYVGAYSILGYPRERNLQNRNVGDETRIGRSSLVRPFSILYEDVKIGSSLRTGGHVQIREGNQIGDNVSLGTHSILERDCVIRDRVRIHSNCFIPEYTVIEEDAWIGPCVTFLNDKYPISRTLTGPRIESGAIVGANSTIFPGVVVGRKAVVAAGSLVTKDVLEESVVMGTPAKKHLSFQAYAKKREKWERIKHQRSQSM